MHRADKDMFHHIRTGQTQSATYWNVSCMSQHICSDTSWLSLPLFSNSLPKAQKCPSSDTSGNILWYVEVHKAAMFKCLCVWISNYAEYCSSSPSLIWMNLLSKQRINNSLWASTSHSPPFLLFLCSPLLLHLPFAHPARPLLIHFFLLFKGQRSCSLEMLFLQAEMDLWRTVNLWRKRKRKRGMRTNTCFPPSHHNLRGRGWKEWLQIQLFFILHNLSL